MFDHSMSDRLLLFAPGAGAPSSHPWMRSWAERLGRFGQVTTFDYPYMREGRKRPDPLPELIAAHREALSAARGEREEKRVVFAGKSMGGRVSCHVANLEQADAVICFGYPLCGGGDRMKLRDAVLRHLTKPVLFIQGTRDPLCPLELLDEVRATMAAPNRLHVVQGGDHSLRVGVRQLQTNGSTRDEVDRAILDAIGNFLADLQPSAG